MSGSVDKEALRKEFQQTLPLGDKEAEFFLEANDWNVGAALNFYYENEPKSEPFTSGSPNNAMLPQDPPATSIPGSVGGMDPALPGAPGLFPTSRPISDNLSNISTPRSSGVGRSTRSSARAAAGADASTSSGPRRSTRNANKPKFATLSSVKDDDRQELYAGGEKSGMAILPNFGEGDDNGEEGGDVGQSLMGQLLKRAAAGAAARQQQEGSGDRPKPKRRGGRVLGSAKAKDNDDSDSEYVDEGDNNESEDEEDEPEEVTRALTIYTNGFTIEGVDRFFSTDDPQNQEYVRRMLSGSAPTDLFGVKPNQSVEVEVKYKNEAYTAPKTRVRGQGRRLGSANDPAPAPAPTATIPGSFPQGSNASVAAASTSSQPVKAAAIEIDESKPKTRLRIVFDDNSTLQPTFNTTSTVGDVREFIINSQPSYSGRNVIIRGGFPLKSYSDMSQTLEEAGLKNTKIIVKIEP
ncbi:protein phosphatase regulator [Mycoemilia scoparia]|uniref:Protein phosphatase regulator n=1 Tax=Mycoemilia scoparia TaxID=417184 RepID=A0A9W7ZRG1_9FUNG|nr:protein phosphatase regulator [Mycoemilia scoparia]